MKHALHPMPSIPFTAQHPRQTTGGRKQLSVTSVTSCRLQHLSRSDMNTDLPSATHKLELCFRTLVPQAEEFGKYALNVCRLVLQIVMGSYTVLITSPESHSQHLLCRARPILGFQCLGEANALVGANLLPKRLDNCLLVLRCVELGKFLALLQDIGRWEMR